MTLVSISSVCVCVCLSPHSEHDLGEDDIYDCVPCEDDGDDIYEDIIRVEVRQPMVRADSSVGSLVMSSSLCGHFYIKHDTKFICMRESNRK